METSMDFTTLDDYVDPKDDLVPGKVRERLLDPKFVEGLATSPMIVAMMQQRGDLIPLFGEVEYVAAEGPKNIHAALEGRSGQACRVMEGNDPRNTFLPAGTFLMGCEADTDDFPILVRAVELLRGGCDPLTKVSYQEARRRPSSN
jgi:hypothetical protein